MPQQAKLFRKCMIYNDKLQFKEQFLDELRGVTETETSSIYWAQLSRFNLKTGTEYRLRNIVF
jgi:arginine/ornithine N-succinyltransferase beta subunit